MAERSKKPTRPAAAQTARGGSSLLAARGGYFELSRQPLEILFALLPFVMLYEYELARVLRTADGVLTNGAHLALLRLFEAFDVDAFALSLPGILLVAILVSWQVLRRGPWIVDLSVVGRMYLESAALALPLLVFSGLVARAAPAVALAQDAAGGAVAASADFASLPFAGQVAVSIGAGLYEELVFRMALITALLALFGDALKLERMPALVVSISLSAIAFAAYHPNHAPDGTFLAHRFIFFLGAGLYFGILYATRGFGVAVATHALYDIAAALLGAAGAVAAGDPAAVP
jgi:membrane protease YdiL (CAAX protease family)